jgi:hypothetical protein
LFGGGFSPQKNRDMLAGLGFSPQKSRSKLPGLGFSPRKGRSKLPGLGFLPFINSYFSKNLLFFITKAFPDTNLLFHFIGLTEILFRDNQFSKQSSTSN